MIEARRRLATTGALFAKAIRLDKEQGAEERMLVREEQLDSEWQRVARSQVVRRRRPFRSREEMGCSSFAEKAHPR